MDAGGGQDGGGDVRNGRNELVLFVAEVDGVGGSIVGKGAGIEKAHTDVRIKTKECMVDIVVSDDVGRDGCL